MSKDGSQRSLLGKQPARLLMVDLTTPFKTEVVEDVCDTLENLYAVSCNFSGPSRIPFFSMVMLHNYQKPVLPFSYVKNNFSRIQTAISDMRTAMYEGDRVNKQDIQFDAALHEACSQYKKQLYPSFQSGGGFSLSLEIVILTCQDEKAIQKQVENAAATLDLEHIKKIQVLCLMNLDISLEEELEPSQCSVTSATSNHSNDSVTGLVEMVKLDPDILYLQDFFNNWLLDTNTDMEHLHLVLPAAETTGLTFSASPLVIKCDLHERVLHPAQLPFYHHFTLHSDASAMKIVFPSNSKAMGMTVPIYKLKVIGQVPVSALCDSLVYGMPMIAQATSCWKIDWDELEKHQQNLKALCYTLAKKFSIRLVPIRCRRILGWLFSDSPWISVYRSIQSKPSFMGLFQPFKELALIAHLIPPESAPSLPGRSRQSKQKSTIHPTGNFVLLPSSSGSLLIKCLAVQELILPYNTTCENQEPTEESISVMNDVLEKVEVLPRYNPLNHPSNLYQSLRSMGIKPATQRQQKRQMEKAETCTNKFVTSSHKQAYKQGNVKTSLREADTPLSYNPVNKSHSMVNPKRRLYNQNRDPFMETEDGDDDFFGTSAPDWSYQGKQKHPFPTSL